MVTAAVMEQNQRSFIRADRKEDKVVLIWHWIHRFIHRKGVEMGSSGMEGKVLEMFEVGPCESAYQMGFLIGQRFSNLIRSRLARDLILQDQLLPFAQTPQAEPLLKALTDNNQKKFPNHWDELLGTAEGSRVPILEVILVFYSIGFSLFSATK